jgi:hypothetical protein
LRKLYQTIFAAFLLLLIFGLALPAAALVTNYRSIGTTTEVLYSIGSASISDGGTTVEFGLGCSLPLNIGKGDRLMVDSEQFFILSRESDTQVKVQAQARENHIEAGFTIERAHHSIRAWEAARNGDLVGDDRREVGVCYNDGPFYANNRFSLATIQGSRTDAVHYMWVTVAEGHRHNGIAGSGVVLDGRNRTKYGIRVKDDYTRVEWLEFKRFRRWGGSASVQVKKAQSVLLGQLIVHDFYSRWFSVVGIKGSRKSNFTARNCIIYDGDTAAIRTNRSGGTALIENCTIYGMSGRGIYEDDGKYTVLNTISIGNREEDFMLVRGIQDYNISSDDTARGPSSLNYLSGDDLFQSITPGEEDFHLKNSAGAIDLAANLAVNFSEDIDGLERPDRASWDIGADEYKIYDSGIWYVDSEKYGNGTSWEDAFETIQQAVGAAKTGEEIWVKMGTYPLLSEVAIDKSVSIYGCFEGTETQRIQRNCRLYDSIVDGQDTVRCFNIKSDGVTLDGFIIRHGTEDMGGGIYAAESSNFKISKCIFQDNHANLGGALFSQAPDGEITNCIFTNNAAAEYGGGLYILNSALSLANCIFSGNEAGDTGGPGGGAVFNAYSFPLITNCTFSGNIARDGTEGGAIFNKNSNPEIANSIFWGNFAGYGPEIVDDDISFSTVIFSNIDWDGYEGINGNIRKLPLWVNSKNRDFHLESNSPCINSGTSEGVDLPETDFEGDPRIVQENVDMGADEYVSDNTPYLVD